MKYKYKPFNSVIIPTSTIEKIELEAAIKTIVKLVSKAKAWNGGGNNNAYEFYDNSCLTTYVAQNTLMTVVNMLKAWSKSGVRFNNDYNVEQALTNELFNMNELFGCEINDRIVEIAIKNRKVDFDLEYLSDFNKRLNTLNSVTIETHKEDYDNDEWEEIL